MPGASVAVKNNATGVVINTLTNNTGVFTVPAIEPGVYTITISLSSFKTAILNDVRVLAATPREVKATLVVGSMADSVEVKGGTELVNPTSSTVQTTLTMDQISGLPLATRNVLNFVTFLPGVDTPTIGRSSTVSGLPQSTLNITLDGVNVQDNYLKTTDGFFARVAPRADAVEEITVTTAAQSAGASGQGAVQIAFVTRSGTNQYTGSFYHYYRHPKLNTNYYFNIQNNLEKNRVILNQMGGRVGGPISIPGLYDGHGKSFFFFNYEEFRQPTEVTRSASMINPLTQTGVFQYVVSGETRSVNVLSLAAANGFTSTPDVTIAAILNEIAAAAGTRGNIIQNTDPNTMRYVFQNPSMSLNRYPTIKIDHNLGSRERLSGSYNFNRIFSDPDILNDDDPIFPGLPNHGSQLSYRHGLQTSLRSTLTSNMINEARVGGAWGPTHFASEVTRDQFADQDFFAVTLGFSLSSPTVNRTPSDRQASNFFIDDSLNWQKGKHSFNFGGTYTQVQLWLSNETVVPGITLGVDTTNDPANAMFTTANFSGASSGQLNNARALYALMTGRVTAINGISQLDEITHKYVYLGERTQRGIMNEYGLFAQDAWRLRPNMTLNYGLRYELQMPFQPVNDVLSMSTMEDLCGISGVGSSFGRPCNIFQPGNLSGKAQPTYVQYSANQPGYKTDINNLAPSLGLAWQPNVQDGFLRKILGDPAQATINAGYAVAYSRNGMSDFTGIYGANPGSQLTTNRNNGVGNLVTAGETWPLLFRDKGRLGPPPSCGVAAVPGCIPVEALYPINATTANSINIFDPNIEVQRSQTYTFGFARSISKNSAITLRYVGTRSAGGWTNENFNEVNIEENGFFNEFKLAQANLQANIAAGRGNTFAYFGAGTGTSPLPTYLGYFTGTSTSLAGDPSKYTPTNFTNTTRLGELALFEPDPRGSAAALSGSATFRANALLAGIAPNFFVMNPAIGSATIRRSVTFTKYDSLQIEYRRRMSQGLSINANFTHALQRGSAFDGIHRDRIMVDSSGGPRQAFKLSWVYQVPVGRGKRFGTDMNRWLDAAVGGWEWDGTGRVQSGRVLTLTGVRLHGMTADELADAYKLRFEKDPVTGVTTIYTLPADIIANTILAFSSDPTSSTGYGAGGPPSGRYIGPDSGPDCIALYPGDCGDPRTLFVTGPTFARFDFSLVKRFQLTKKVNIETRIDIFNVFNAINFNPVFAAGSGNTINQVTSAYTDISNTNDPGGRIGQLMWRINW